MERKPPLSNGKVIAIAATMSAAAIALGVGLKPGTVSSPAPATTVPAATTSTVASGQVTYQVGEVGTVTVDQTTATVSLLGVVPNPGWAVTSMDGATGTVTVVFSDLGGDTVTFTAAFVGGVLTVQTTSSSTTTTQRPVVRPTWTASPTTTVRPAVKPRPTTTTVRSTTTTAVTGTTAGTTTTTTRRNNTTTTECQRGCGDD